MDDDYDVSIQTKDHKKQKPFVLHIPISTQWVTFPTVQHDAMEINWSEGRIIKRARYYKTKCFWGNLPLEQEPRWNVSDKYHPKPVALSSELVPKLTIQGQTNLYIAAEYVDPEFCGGPMQDYHVKSLFAKHAGHDEPSWITLQLNQCFHYGQEKASLTNRYQRWLVYHPEIAPTLQSPKIFQHRFTGHLATDLFTTGLDGLSKVAPHDYKDVIRAVHKSTTVGVDFLKGIVGDPLHRFLGPVALKEVQNLENASENKPMTKADTAENRLIARLINLQMAELMTNKFVQDRSKTDEKFRNQFAAELAQKVNRAYTAKKTFWSWLLGSSKSKGEIVTQLDAAIAESGDASATNFDEDLIKECLGEGTLLTPEHIKELHRFVGHTGSEPLVHVGKEIDDRPADYEEGSPAQKVPDGQPKNPNNLGDQRKKAEQGPHHQADQPRRQSRQKDYLVGHHRKNANLNNLISGNMA